MRRDLLPKISDLLFFAQIARQLEKLDILGNFDFCVIPNIVNDEDDHLFAGLEHFL